MLVLIAFVFAFVFVCFKHVCSQHGTFLYTVHWRFFVRVYIRDVEETELFRIYQKINIRNVSLCFFSIHSKQIWDHLMRTKPMEVLYFCRRANFSLKVVKKVCYIKKSVRICSLLMLSFKNLYCKCSNKDTICTLNVFFNCGLKPMSPGICGQKTLDFASVYFFPIYLHKTI